MTMIEQLRNVPAAIRRWFGGEEAIDIIEAIERQFGLPSDETVIPDLLFEVEVKDLPLGDLAKELEYELKVTPQVARNIYEEIKVRLLAPIAAELVAFGIGTAELAGFVAPAPQPARPPVVTVAPAPLPIRPAEAPARPAAPAPAPGVAPKPVMLQRDVLASQTSVAPKPAWNVGGITGTGDVSLRASAPAAAPRPARVDLGAPSSRVDETLRSIFVHRETPKPQEVDYAASRLPSAGIPSSAAPVPLASMAQPSAPADPGPAITPRIEVVSIPASPAPVAEPNEGGGFMDAIIRKVAPWHYAKFGAASERASAALETPVPTKSVDYSADAAPAPTKEAPLRIDDLPRPPAG